MSAPHAGMKNNFSTLDFVSGASALICLDPYFYPREIINSKGLTSSCIIYTFYGPVSFIVAEAKCMVANPFELYSYKIGRVGF
jgi:hypothetical protein